MTTKKFDRAFYEKVYKEIREADHEVETEDNAYGYFDLFLECGQYDRTRYTTSIIPGER